MMGHGGVAVLGEGGIGQRLRAEPDPVDEGLDFAGVNLGFEAVVRLGDALNRGRAVWRPLACSYLRQRARPSGHVRGHLPDPPLPHSGQVQILGGEQQ